MYTESLNWNCLDVEKYENDESFYKAIYSRKAAEKNSSKGELCSRLLCCYCCPCIPLWGRALCCFVFLGICVLLGFFLLFVSTFKAPQITFLGNIHEIQQQQNGMYNVKYCLQNNNFFGFDFEKIKFVVKKKKLAHSLIIWVSHTILGLLFWGDRNRWSGRNS